MTSTDVTIHTSTLTEQMDFARTVVARVEGGAVSILPESYRGNPANVLIAVGLGASMGLSPAESLYRIAVIKGKPTAGAELIAANVRKAGHRLRVTGTDSTCTATVVRADDPDFEFAVTRDLAWARQMGLASNDNYRKQPGTMLQWRAITAVARLACPEALYGVAYTADEVTDIGAVEAAPPSGAERVRAALHPDAPAEDVQDAEVVEDTPAGPPVEPITKGQLTALHASLKDAGLDKDRDAALAFYAEVVGHKVGSSKDLDRDQASAVIDALKRKAAPEPGSAEDPWATDAAAVAARDAAGGAS